MAWQPELVLAEIRSSGIGLGEPLHYRPTTGSTNDDALAAISRGEPHGSLFLADRQDHGRGRKGNDWWSNPGDSITCSIILGSRRSAEELPALTLVVGLSVAEALEPLVAASGSPLALKWPNDIVHAGKKLAGMLLETRQHPGAGAPAVGEQSLAAGIGINVNGSLPDELGPSATSLELITHRTHSREALLVSLLERLAANLPLFEARGLEPLLARLQERDALHDRKLSVGGIAGVGRGLDRTGRLLVATAGGIHAVAAGVVTIHD